HRRPGRDAGATRQGGPAAARAGPRLEAPLQPPALLGKRRRERPRDRGGRQPPRLPAVDERRGAAARPPRHELQLAERRARRAELLERWDLAALARYAMRDTRFRHIVRTRLKRVRWSAPTFAKEYVNNNLL